MKPHSKWYRLPTQDRILILQTIPFLSVIRICLVLLPLDYLLRLLTRIAKTLPAKDHPNCQSQKKTIWVIEAVGKYVLGDGPCLTQALAAQFILARHNQSGELCIGIAKEEQGKLVAHAWIESNGGVVIGGSEAAFKRYIRLPSLKGKMF